MGKECQGPLPPPSPHGFLHHHWRSILSSHHGHINQGPSAQGRVGGLGLRPRFRLGCSSLDFIVGSLAGLGVGWEWLVHGGHSGTRNIRVGRMSTLVLPSCFVHEGNNDQRGTGISSVIQQQKNPRPADPRPTQAHPPLRCLPLCSCPGCKLKQPQHSSLNMRIPGSQA